jgi:hypothetical protein
MHLPSCPAALGNLLNYTYSRNPNKTFMWNTQPMNFSAAEAYCNERGGHLASFANLAEQKDVETALKDVGLLLPTFHTAYWMGMQSDVWPTFYWLDNVTPNPSKNSYQHWGTYRVGTSTIPEPNNIAGTETCGAGNLTQSYGGASGWSDVDCNRRLPFMCTIMGE